MHTRNVELRATYGRIARRVVPILVAGYIVAFVDRVNVGFAKLQFLHDLQFNEAIFGFGAGLFYIGYLLFEVPSNLVLERFGAKLTLTRIMLLWGLISASMAFVSTPTQYYVMRLLLGAAEAGFFPGVILYLSYWFPDALRGRITALFAMGAPVAGLIGSPISGWLMSLDGMHGLRGWQILFIYEGIPSILLALVYYLVIEDGPQKAKWLSADERRAVALDVSTKNANTSKSMSIKAKLLVVSRLPKVYALAIAYFSVQAGAQAVSLWTPTLIRRFGVTLTSTGFLGALPFFAGLVAMFVMGRSSDRHMERRWHYFAAMWTTAISLVSLALGANSLTISLVILTIAGAGAFAALPLFWTIPPAELPGEIRAGGIALISTSGALGAFISPVVIGWASDLTASPYGGIAAVGVMAAISGTAILFVTGSGERAPVA